MLNQVIVKEKIHKIIDSIKPGLRILSSASIFGKDLNFDSRDGAYLLLNIESEFQVEIEKIIVRVEEQGGYYSVDSLVIALIEELRIKQPCE